MYRKRTTVTAAIDELSTLEFEAKRRGVPLTIVLSEAISDKAKALRKTRRPRLGVGSSGGRSAGAAQLTSEPIAEDPKD